MDLPVLIYAAREGCGACKYFEPHWEKVKERLGNEARLVKFNITREAPPPGPLRKYTTWYPSIFLAGPKSYFRCFTPDDQVNEEEYDDNYTIKAQKVNATEGPAGYEFARQNNDAQQIETWFRQVAPTVSLYDEPTPPRSWSRS